MWHADIRQLKLDTRLRHDRDALFTFYRRFLVLCEGNPTAPVTKGQWCKVLCCLYYWREQAVEQAKVIERNHLSSYWWPGTEWQHESIPAVFIWDWCSFPDCKVIVLGTLSKYGGRNTSILHGVSHVAIRRWCQWPVLHQQKRKRYEI